MVPYWNIPNFSLRDLSWANLDLAEVSASMYWRSKIWGRNFGLKLKFYYTNRPLGTRKWHQNSNWTTNETFLLLKFQTDRSIWNFTNKNHHLSNLKLLAISILLFFWSICAIFSFNLAYYRPNSVKYVKVYNLSNTWQSLLIHPVDYSVEIQYTSWHQPNRKKTVVLEFIT